MNEDELLCKLRICSSITIHSNISNSHLYVSGMLLEIEDSDLRRLLRDPTQLALCIQQAYDALIKYTDKT